ncbi:yt521-b-like splicing factor [Stemphylium lycopersici]|uniref:Yt521-b-like splicing factor n=1 Tax=Stemphylium lycopersici TaxID=183478 RepID=A0A364MTW3_STELY|nr:yt521-b-like splicing factor [Stemphylium lycopersici]RAR05849.1 yt521-b-like splicing factor [Stemphylium lycopersici]
MAFFWVQQWVPLPVVYEQHMGDVPSGPRPQDMDGANATTSFAHDGNTSASFPTTLKSSDNNSPFYSQLSALPQGQHRQDFRSPAHSPGHYQPQDHSASSLNMGAMTGALPDFGAGEDASLNAQAVPRSLSGASASALAYQLGHNVQVSGNMPSHSPYGPGFATGPPQQHFMHQHGSQYGTYPSFTTNQPRPAGAASMQAPYQSYQHASQYMYYPTPYGPQGHYNPGFTAQAQQGQTMYGRRGSLSNPANFPNDPASLVSPYGAQFAQSIRPVSSIPRGPPRKPKQSGHALWVGNLPPGTTVVALKDHFSRDATKDIESLFLISKSNCAFVNYRTEESCTAAMHRFHDSRFNGVRLVCRLRRSSAPASGVPTAPSAMIGQQKNTSRPATPVQDGLLDDLEGGAVELPVHKSAQDDEASANVASKYFIVKSLTLQDLELSVRNGIWATQSHNEDVLNKAFRSAENVYLIFSANKSGEYFGYARMVSSILEDGSRVIGSAPKPEAIVDAPDVPKSIATAATEWAPRGRIIDDSARGTIFWEAELSDAEAEEQEEASKAEKDGASQQADVDTSAVAQSWGKPFKIEWVSTNRLPFYRTRGLRNPWNANREVKIARDGTELEPSVGERLVQMFHRPTAGAPVMPSGSAGIVPQMRPF